MQISHITGGVVIAVLVSMSLGSELHAVETRSVDCDAGGVIAIAIKQAKRRADRSEQIRIEISGTCEGEVEIVDDNLELRSEQQNDPATIQGTIFIDGAHNVVVRGLVITGPGGGIVVTNGANASIIRNNITRNGKGEVGGTGVSVSNNSHADLVNNLINRNGQPSPWFDCGVSVVRSSTVFSHGNKIKRNSYCAVFVGDLSHFRSGFFVPRNTGESPDPGDLDVYIQRGCTLGSAANSCGAAGTVGIGIDKNSTFDFRNASSTVRIELFNGSIFDGRQGQIFGDISVNQNSGVRAQNRPSENPPRDITGNGTIVCDDSSYTLYDNQPTDNGCSDSFSAPS